MARKLAKKKTAVGKTQKKAKIIPGKKISVKNSFTKTELLASLVGSTELPKKKVVEFLDMLQAVMFAHVKAGHPFALPGIFKVSVTKKAATKQRKGINPFTGEPTVFKAKPARKVVKIRAMKKLKQAV